MSELVDGDLLDPSDPQWEAARRVNNQRVQGAPALIARCAGTADVRAALSLARERDLRISVRGGGHSVAGYSSNDGGLVIDLTRMREVHVNPAAATAWIGGGALAGDLVGAAGEFGLAPVTGVSPEVGVAGLVLGLGEGYLTPKHGFGCDSVLAFELVTAAGTVLHVSADEHPDLFWAMRGAGANFGVVTALELRLYPSPQRAVGGWLTFGHRDALDVTRHMWRVMQEGSEHFFPFAVYEPDDTGELRIRVIPGHTGPAEVSSRELDELRRCGTLESDDTRTMSYAELLAEFDESQDQQAKRMIWDLYRLDFGGSVERKIELVLEQTRAFTPRSHLTLWRTVPIDLHTPSAAPRTAGVSLFLGSFWHEPPDDEGELSWLRDTAAALEESGLVDEAANAVNHVAHLTERRLRRLYGDSGYERLALLKAKFDPDNRFTGNANIPPAR